MARICNVNANQNSCMTCAVGSFQSSIAIPSRKYQNILKGKKTQKQKPKPTRQKPQTNKQNKQRNKQNQPNKPQSFSHVMLKDQHPAQSGPNFISPHFSFPHYSEGTGLPAVCIASHPLRSFAISQVKRNFNNQEYGFLKKRTFQKEECTDFNSNVEMKWFWEIF